MQNNQNTHQQNINQKLESTAYQMNSVNYWDGDIQDHHFEDIEEEVNEWSEFLVSKKLA